MAQAIPYWQRAGQRAIQRSANLEALGHLTKGLELLATLPETPARAQQELDVLIALGPALMVTKGYAAPEVEQTYARARALCQQVGNTPQLFPALRGLCEFYFNHGALSTGRELGEQLYRLAQHEAGPTLLLEACDALGIICFHLGEFATARTYLEQGITLTDPAAQQALVLRHAVAPGVRCLAVAANTLWCLGYPAQAVRRSQEALALAQALAHPHSLAVAQHFAALTPLSLPGGVSSAGASRGPPDAGNGAGIPTLGGYGLCWRNWALAVQGQGEVDLAQMHQGLTAIMAIGQTLARPVCLVLLAEAAGYVGRGAEGLRLLAEALEAVEASERRELLAEAASAPGRVAAGARSPDNTPEAEACFHQALDIARRQAAKSLGAAGRHEPESTLAAAGEASRSAGAPGTGL